MSEPTDGICAYCRMGDHCDCVAKKHHNMVCHCKCPDNKLDDNNIFKPTPEPEVKMEAVAVPPPKRSLDAIVDDVLKVQTEITNCNDLLKDVSDRCVTIWITLRSPGANQPERQLSDKDMVLVRDALKNAYEKKRNSLLFNLKELSEELRTYKP